ncbi:MAG: PKD domain-containing protein [Thermoplasmatales archaeon]|nr:PKD domain-containing protein [Thermoplasmatales archaeon]
MVAVKLKRIIFIILLLLLGLFRIEKANPETIYVDDDGGGDFTRISDAISAASPGDTVYVYEGVYNESIAIDKNIKLIGERNGTIINCQNGNHAIIINSDSVSIEGFTIVGSSDGYFGIYLPNRDNCEIKNCNFSFLYGGVYIFRGKNILVAENIFYNNSYAISGVGFRDSIIKENYFIGNRKGILLGANTINNTIFYNTFISNLQDAYDESIMNNWSHLNVGNYWDKYSGADADGDGIGDAPYPIEPPIKGNFDFYPLMEEYGGIDIFPPDIVDLRAIPLIQEPGKEVNITCNILDKEGVSSAIINITTPEGNYINESLININSTNAYYFVISFEKKGVYNYYVWTEDVNNNSRKSSIKNFIIAFPPSANFTFQPEEPTDLDNITFNASNSYDIDGYIVNYTWNFGDGSVGYGKFVEHRYSDDGKYKVKLTVYDNDGAFSIIEKEINVSNIIPFVNFTFEPDSPTVWEEIRFYDLSYDLDGSIKIWEWDFGDGTNISGGKEEHKNPKHSYRRNGIFNVTLTVYDDDYAKNTTIKQITVNDFSSPSIENLFAYPNPQEVGEEVNISCNIFDDVEVVEAKINITFPNGGYINESMLSGEKYYYKIQCHQPGNHTFFIFTKDASNNSNTSEILTFTIIVQPEPPSMENVTFPASGQYGLPLNISCFVHDNVEVKEVKIVFSFGNFSMSGITDDKGNGIYYYNSTFDIGLHTFFIYAVDVNDFFNISGNYSFEIVDTLPPEIENIGFEEIVEAGEVNVSCSVFDNRGVREVRININGVERIMSNYGNTFYIKENLSSGNYTFYILAEDLSNNTNQTTPFNFIVTYFPVAIDDYATTDEDTPVIIAILANDYDIDGTINASSVTITQNPSYGNVTVNANGTVTYIPSANYHGSDSFKYKVKDNSNAWSNEAWVNITISSVNDEPFADFECTPSNPKVNETVLFIDLSYDVDGFVVNWTWNFGDGSIAYEKNASHKYNESGEYNVILKVIDNEGKNSTISKEIYVGEVLFAEFMVINENPCSKEEIIFVDLSQGTTSWLWDFGDGSISYERNPKHIYQIGSYYNVTLIVSDGSKNASVSKIIQVATKIEIVKNEKNVVNYLPWFGEEKNASQIAEIIGSDIMPVGSVIAKWNVSKGGFDSYVVGISPPSYDFMVSPYDVIVLRVAKSGYFIEKAFPIENRFVNVTKNEKNVVNHFCWSAFYSINASQIAEIIGSDIMPVGSVIAKWNVSKGGFDSYVVGISPPSYDFMVYPGDAVVLRVEKSGEFLIEVRK